MNNWSSFLENRFVLCVGCGSMSSFLLWFGKLDASNYTFLILGTVGAYITGVAFDRSKEHRENIAQIIADAPAP
jgi:hypothetical protein